MLYKGWCKFCNIRYIYILLYYCTIIIVLPYSYIQVANLQCTVSNVREIYLSFRSNSTDNETHGNIYVVNCFPSLFQDTIYYVFWQIFKYCWCYLCVMTCIKINQSNYQFKNKLYLMKCYCSSILVVPGICAKEEEDLYMLNLCVYV
jgi:hypothetical protein